MKYKTINVIVQRRRAKLRQGYVSGWFAAFVKRLFERNGSRPGMPVYENPPPCPPQKKAREFKKVYTIVKPDEYDKTYGCLVEYGFETVEEYFYLKGRIKQLEVFEQLHPNIL